MVSSCFFKSLEQDQEICNPFLPSVCWENMNSTPPSWYHRLNLMNVLVISRPTLTSHEDHNGKVEPEIEVGYHLMAYFVIFVASNIDSAVSFSNLQEVNDAIL